MLLENDMLDIKSFSLYLGKNEVIPFKWIQGNVGIFYNDFWNWWNAFLYKGKKNSWNCAGPFKYSGFSWYSVFLLNKKTDAMWLIWGVQRKFEQKTFLLSKVLIHLSVSHPKETAIKFVLQTVLLHVCESAQ